MEPTDLLKDEHRVIEKVLTCLENMADECLAEGVLDAPAAKKAIDFFQVFADRCHHAKEEKLLFPAMEARGFSREHGPIARMLYEHSVGRRFLNGLASAVEPASKGYPKAMERFADQARAYNYWLREHIAKEDQHLFPMANRVLTEEDKQVLFQSFESLEHEEMRTGTHEQYLKIANELADRFDVLRAHEPARSAACCGHH